MTAVLMPVDIRHKHDRFLYFTKQLTKEAMESIACSRCSKEVSVEKTVYCKSYENKVSANGFYGAFSFQQSDENVKHRFCYNCVYNVLRKLINERGTISVHGDIYHSMPNDLKTELNEVLCASHDMTFIACSICSEDVSAEDVVYCRPKEDKQLNRPEEHPCCNECIAGEVRKIIKKGDSIDLCGLSCISTKIIVKNLPASIGGRIETMIQNANLAALGMEVESCKSCGFSAVPEKSKEEEQIFTCPECKAQQCRFCFEKWTEEHEVLSCDEMRALGLRHITDGKCEECGDKCRKWRAEDDKSKDDESVSDESKIQCLICTDEVPTEETVWCSAKNKRTGTEVEHSFCSSCVEQQVKEVVDGSGAVDLLGIPCPSGRKCSNIISWSSLRGCVTGVLKKRLGILMQNANLRATGINFESCKNCGYTALPELPKEQDQIFRCPECGSRHCSSTRLCSEKWTEEHGRRPCSEDARTAFRQYQEKLTKAVIRTCTKCKLNYEKASGCNKIVCKCGAYYCYLCRQNITGYEHFCRCGTYPAPGTKCHQCGKTCGLYANPQLYIDYEVAKIKQEARGNPRIGMKSLSPP
ncbi:unnamed protein product [Enterobius vermicularis]|uniref:RING-type domain-containing protein n=1 Tax=Enterobius vermicularis TaxID=51028 RepID=A0A0N4UWT0_ENTVE|nr:unnamed protein product [Enterobius vermicularis]